MSMANKPVYVAIEVKKTGRSLLHPLVEVAFAEGRDDGKPIKKTRWSIRCTPESEQRIHGQMADQWQNDYKEDRDQYQAVFWDLNKSLWSEIQADQETKPASVIYPLIADYLEDLYDRYDETTHIVWLSTNPLVDIAHLDFWLLSSGARFMGCRIDSVSGKANAVQNPIERIAGLASYQVQEVMKLRDETVKKAEWKLGRSETQAEFTLFTQFAIDQVTSRYGTTAAGPTSAAMAGLTTAATPGLTNLKIAS